VADMNSWFHTATLAKLKTPIGSDLREIHQLYTCQGATPTSDKARRPTPTTSDRGQRWRLIGKEGSASKVLSGTYENVAEVGTGRVALSMQRLRQGGILRNDFNDFNLESLRLSLSDL